MQTSETYMISGVPAPINRAIPSYYSHVRHNGITPEHAGALIRPPADDELSPIEFAHAAKTHKGTK